MYPNPNSKSTTTGTEVVRTHIQAELRPRGNFVLTNSHKRGCSLDAAGKNVAA